MHHRFLQRAATIGMLVVALSLVAACSGSTTTANGPTPTSQTPVAATPIPASPTPTSATKCTDVPGFAGTITPNPGMAFNNVPFPANSVGTTPVLHSNVIGLFTIYLMQVCAPNTSKAGMQSFYGTQMIAQGYTQSPTLPFDGGYQAPCGDPYCWGYPAIAPRYVGLEKVTELGNNLVSYQLRLFVPPPYPTCSPITTPYAFFLAQHTAVPLPPLTVIEPGDGSGSILSNRMCSAGTANSIDTFMSSELGKLGFHFGPFNPGGNASFNCNGFGSGWISPDNSYAVKWETAGGSAQGNGWSWALQSCR